MFETYVRDLITSILGSYFENIDQTPVEVSVLRGDIVVRNVEVKSTVMVDFYMPFKIIAGRIGTLTLKVPWSQLYTGQLEGTMKDLFLIMSPCQTAPYNPEEEERYKYETKMKLVEEIEEKQRWQQAASAASAASPSSTRDIPPIPTNYKETLLTLLVKNLHLKVDGIHIRYEDSISNPIAPFTFGIFLNHLEVRTVDSGVPDNGSNPIKTFRKNVTLHGLGAYLNSDGNLFGNRFHDKNEMLSTLKTLHYTKKHTLKCLIGPISTEVKLRISPHPELLDGPFTLPKGSMELSLDEIQLGISNLQFQNFLRLFERVEFMSRGRAYRQFRPQVSSYSGNYATWWEFATECVLSEIRRKRQCWYYSNIKSHRDLSRLYSQNYYQKVVLNNKTTAVKEVLTRCEKALDAFNIVYIRAQVHVKKESVERLELENRRRYGWLSSLFGWNAAQLATDVETHLAESLTDAEKGKLYEVLGFGESDMPTIYPQDYVGYYVALSVKTLTTFVTHYPSTLDTAGKQLVKLAVNDALVRFECRPAVSNSILKGSIATVEADTVETLGTRPVPILRTQVLSSSEKFLEVEWEKRPLKSKGQKRITVTAKALEVMYNAKTLRQIRSCFRFPKEIHLQALKFNAKIRLNEYTEKLCLYIRNWIQTSSEGQLILRFEVDAPYIIVPESGEMGEKSNAVIIDCGKLLIQSKMQGQEGLDLVTFTQDDPFSAKLSEVRISMAVPGLENGVLLPIKKSPLGSSTMRSGDRMDSTLINQLMAAIREMRSRANLAQQNSSIVDLMTPFSISAAVSKWEEESVVKVKFSDITFKFNSVSTELFRRISNSWIDRFDGGLSIYMEEEIRITSFVLNSAIHNYVKQSKEGTTLFNSLKSKEESVGFDHYLAHCLLGNPSNTHLFMLTSARVLYWTLANAEGKPAVLWEHAFDSFGPEPVKVEEGLENGIKFTLKEPSTTSTGPVLRSNQVFVPIQDSVLCDWMLGKISGAMREHGLLRACDEHTST